MQIQALLGHARSCTGLVSETSFQLFAFSTTKLTVYKVKHGTAFCPSFKVIFEHHLFFSFDEGVTLSDWNNHNKAITSFNKAICLKPEVVKNYIARGESYLQICDFQSAILNFKKACILDPDNDQTYSRLAFLYFLQGQCLFDEKLYSEALESFSRAAEMKPDMIGYHTRR